MSTEIITNIALFIAGLIFGNWFAIGRDIRKEFNEIADVVYLKLNKELEHVKETGAVADGPNEKDFENLKRRLSFLRKRKFLETLKKYKNSKSIDNWTQDEYNQPFYKDSKKVSESIQELLKFTARRKYFPFKIL